MSNVQQQQQQAAQSVEQLKKQAQANFGSAKSTIQDKASQVHQTVVRPVASRYYDLMQRRPLIMTFVSTFLATSFVPIVSFLLFSAGTLAVIGGSALVFTLFWTGVIVSSAAAVLGLTLAATGVASVFLGAWAVGAWALIRLYHHISVASSLPHGIRNFDHEMRRLFFGVDSSNGKSPGDAIRGAASSLGDVKVSQ